MDLPLQIMILDTLQLIIIIRHSLKERKVQQKKWEQRSIEIIGIASFTDEAFVHMRS